MLACFVTDIRPRSSQGGRRGRLESYKQRLAEDFHNQGTIFSEAPFSLPLYSKVIYIHLRDTDLDVDNMSKPIIDAFNGIMYTDDKIIKHMVCSKISFNEFEFYNLNLKGLPAEVIDRFDTYLEEKSEHILYYEIGVFSESMVFIGRQDGETYAEVD